MKLLLENFKKNMEERFRGPTDDPSFSDPGYNEPAGYDELSDEVTELLNAVTKGRPMKLPTGGVLSFDQDSEQYLLDGEVFANDYDEAEEQLMSTMADSGINEEKIKELVKERILENLGAGETNLAQQRLRGAAGAAQQKLDNPAVTRAIGMATKRLQKAPPQQKVDFLISMIQKLGIQPEELQTLMSRLKGSAKKAADIDADQEVAEE